ncbi:MAG: hypothetical protein E5Y12_26760 [Mesorhizobium sp.]|nr:MAG: hypothetical protein E5Y12_26760 [Mesorhizobium sp.]
MFQGTPTPHWNANASLRWNTPHPSRRCAPIHLPPQGGEGKAPRLTPPYRRRRNSAGRRGRARS